MVNCFQCSKVSASTAQALTAAQRSLTTAQQATASTTQAPTAAQAPRASAQQATASTTQAPTTAKAPQASAQQASAPTRSNKRSRPDEGSDADDDADADADEDADEDESASTPSSGWYSARKRKKLDAERYNEERKLRRNDRQGAKGTVSYTFNRANRQGAALYSVLIVTCSTFFLRIKLKHARTGISQTSNATRRA